MRAPATAQSACTEGWPIYCSQSSVGFLVLRRVRDAEGAAVVVADIALAGLGRRHDALGGRRQGDADLADHRRAVGIGRDPGGVLAVDPALRGAAGGERGRDLVPGARRRLGRRVLQQVEPEGQRLLGLGAVHACRRSRPTRRRSRGRCPSCRRRRSARSSRRTRRTTPDGPRSPAPSCPTARGRSPCRRR